MYAVYRYSGLSIDGGGGGYNAWTIQWVNIVLRRITHMLWQQRDSKKLFSNNINGFSKCIVT